MMVVPTPLEIEDLEKLLIDYHESKGNTNPPEGLRQLLSEARPHVKRENLEKMREDALKARNELVEKNRRLTTKIASKYRPKNADPADLLQAADLGLLKAATHYDYTTGNSFSNYAFHWIKESIIREIQSQARTIRLPAHVQENIRQYSKAVRKHLAETGRFPSNEEAAKKLRWSLKKTRRISRNARKNTSLNKPVFSQDPRSDEVVDTMPAENTDITLQLENEDLLKKIVLASNLTDQELEVIRHRFGLKETPKKTLQEIGEILGVSRERIRQIEAKALEKMREKAAIHGLK